MSRTDNTARKFDTNFPEWLANKLWIESIDPELPRSCGGGFGTVGISRRTQKSQWRREVEMELNA
jgi:hypothetical protein